MPGKTEYRGLEASLDWRMDETFGWNFELKPYVSLTKMFRYYNTEMRKNTGSVADLSVSYGLIFDDEDSGLRASVNAAYYGHQMPHYTTTQVEFGGDTVVDLHLAKRLYQWERGDRLFIKADILNLTDKFYETMRNYPEEGRSFMLGLRYEY
ncbi:MAG: TonB-dependent receptor [Candidatus Adiutrix sp.]|nr:TonB-dependent receptor [Candidatus Adiutrix sp.]